MNRNVRSIFLLCKEDGRRSMIPRKRGRIMNASIASPKGNQPGGQPMLAYNTSKAAVINLTRAFAIEWGKYGINVNALAPGMFPSNMTRGMIERVGIDSILALTPLKRIGDGGDLKGATGLFASDTGKHITGRTQAVDGGRSDPPLNEGTVQSAKELNKLPLVYLAGHAFVQIAHDAYLRHLDSRSPSLDVRSLAAIARGPLA